MTLFTGNDKSLKGIQYNGLPLKEAEAYEKVFFISDHHFGHKQIINFETRPFEDVDVMNASMIESWNSVVGKDDKYSI